MTQRDDRHPHDPPATENGEASRGGRPIADYGLLSDCTTAALVSRDGSVDWLCLPRFDSPALFAGLLDPDAGHWSIRPRGRSRPSGATCRATLVVETTFLTESGTAALSTRWRSPRAGAATTSGWRAPANCCASSKGSPAAVDLVLELRPRPEYGLVRPLVRQTADGARTFGGPNQIVVRAGVPLACKDATMRADFRVGATEAVGFALRWAAPESRAPGATPPDQVRERIADTVAGWRSWEEPHDIYDGPHRDKVRLSARLLRGLTYRPTGAIVAAPTTSLPESVGGERNWDYRYAWIRDASLTIEALHIGACSDEAEDFVSFMTSAAGGHAHKESSLQIMYGIGGEHDLTERSLPHLRGWRGSRPVRVGNGAWRQAQHDVYGELLAALHRTQEKLGELHPEIQHFVVDLADSAARRWPEPDAGMWEMRGEPRHHLSSKVLAGSPSTAPWTWRRASVSRPERGMGAERDRIREAVCPAAGARSGRRTPRRSTPLNSTHRRC
jgi:hypothetical protein